MAHSDVVPIRHHFTVDVEEHFQVSALEPYVPRASWDSLPSRVEHNTRRLLELLAERGATGTFFTLGWIARRHRDLVREIASGGHEIASHGWGHERVTTLDRSGFQRSVRDAKAILEDTSGTAVHGYRAPSFSIVRGGEWALDVLIEEGYRYDSSLVPVRRRGYGYAGGKRDPYQLVRRSGSLTEVPPATLRMLGATLPAGGGAYLRLLPYLWVKSAIAASERRSVPATFYIHPWEVDPDQPRVAVSAFTRVRHYRGLEHTEDRIRALLRDFSFQPIATTLALREARI